ncbi:unnamed protein product [Angiostrongylus costaricensis]|uniref:Large ribosomal subunit protein bL36m n=1 Tax=Angiostrongylus costaricensis TaxID=334426 RepID=A0A3P7HUG2_ANGCS|nr:unnamed protein product [Angiostrongylus costaricensis]
MERVIARLFPTADTCSPQFYRLSKPKQQISHYFGLLQVKSRLKLRCRSCYFIRVNGRMHVECREHPRHKAREVFNVKLLW